MGTKTDPRRTRAQRRGLASFVSFLLLFAFALGQSSISALADDGGTSPVAGEDAAPPGDAGTRLPAADAPSEEAPPADAPADEPPAEEAPPAGDPAEEAPPAPAPDDQTTDSGSSGGAATAAPATRRVSKLDGTRANRNLRTAGAAAAAQLDGGDIGLDFVAAGPFTYNHATGLGTYPTFGYNDRTIDKDDGVVESLESGDFQCGDLVTFFTQVSVDDGAAGSGTVVLNYTFGNETTGQPGLGFDNIVSAALNTPDDGNVGVVADNDVTLSNVFIETQGYNQVHGTVTITNLAPGEVAIVRVIAHLFCIPGETPTGNILNAIESGTADGDTISVGQQTVPMKTTGFIPAPAIDIEKFCPEAAAVGDEITYDITVTNTGNEDLDTIVVTDTVDGHPAAGVSGEPATLAAGDSVLLHFTYTVVAGDPDPLPNSATVTAAGVFSNTTVTDTDGCETDILHPAIDVTKSCPEFGQVGDTITYTITVENTGDEDLENVTVEDTLLGDLSASFADTLAVGASESHDFDYTVLAGDPDPLPNEVTATGSGVTSSDEVSDTDSCETDILNPAIDVSKSCPEFGQEGDTITYTITVENIGDETLENVTVEDTLLGDLSASFADTFAPGDIESHDFDYTVQVGDPDPLPNEVTATGSGVTSGDEVSDTDSCETDILHPSIDVSKSCPESGQVGDTITYTITVTNTGDEDLENVTVVDTLLGDLSASFADDLAVGASESHDFDYTIQAGDPDPLPNDVTATATGVTSADEVSDSAGCETDILNPSIDVEKSCAALAHVGDTVTYTITVTNTGDVDLTNVTVSDTILGDLSASFADDLAIGASESHDFAYTVLETDPDPLVNVVTATGVMVQSETTVSDTDDCTTDLIHPAIDIVKTVDEDLVPVGTTVTYTYAVTNTGDTTLYDVSVDDDIMGHIGDIPVLEPGQTVELTKDFVVGEDPVTNVATATGEDILGRSVSATDDAVVTPILGENPPPPPTPFTGSDAGRLGLIAMALLGLGATLVAVSRRRRSEDGTA